MVPEREPGRKRLAALAEGARPPARAESPVQQAPPSAARLLELRHQRGVHLLVQARDARQDGRANRGERIRNAQRVRAEGDREADVGPE